MRRNMLPRQVSVSRIAVVAGVMLMGSACSRGPSPPASPTRAPTSSQAQTAAANPTQNDARRMSAACSGRFEDMDTNSDARVSRDEFMAAQHGAADPARVFAARDADGNGVLSEVEFCTGPNGWQVAQSETETGAMNASGMNGGSMMQGGAMMHGGGVAQGGGMMQGPGTGDGPHNGMMHGCPAMCGPSFLAIDVNRDGRITRTELNAFYERHDANHDGSIEQTELCPTSLAAAASPSSGAASAAPDPRGPGK